MQQLIECQRHYWYLLAQDASRLVHETMDQERQIAGAGTQRWQMEMVGAQPVIQVLAKRAGTDTLGDVAIGGADDAGAALPRSIRAEGIKGPILQNAAI